MNFDRPQNFDLPMNFILALKLNKPKRSQIQFIFLSQEWISIWYLIYNILKCTNYVFFFTGLLTVSMSLIKLDNHLLLSFISFLAQLSIIGRMICHNWKIGLVWIAAVIIGIELPFHFFNPSKNNPSGKPHCRKFNSFFLTGQKINSIPVQLGQFFKYNPVGGWTPNLGLSYCLNCV